MLPATVPDANPPIPLVTSHSRDSAASRLPQTSRPNLIFALCGGPATRSPSAAGFLRDVRALFAGALPGATADAEDEAVRACASVARCNSREPSFLGNFSARFGTIVSTIVSGPTHQLQN